MNPEKVRALLAKHSTPKLTPAALRLIQQAAPPPPAAKPRVKTNLPPDDYTRRKPLRNGLHRHSPGFYYQPFHHHD